MNEATGVILALLLLLGVPQRADSRPCPRQCSCPQPAELHCTFRSLFAIPPGISTEVQRINLGFNSIHQMTDRSLSGLRKLELLMLHGNDLHGVPDGALRDLHSLQMLKLSYNKLREISRRSLQGLRSLARLHLDHNRLEFIHPDAFQGLTSLRLLQLDGNRLRQLHPATLSTFSVLGHFPLSTLRHLYLADNNLTTLHPGLLESAPLLGNLQLHGNRWSCDCHLRWLPAWDKANPGVLRCKKDKDAPGGELCPVCALPTRLRGKELQGVAVEDLACSGPVITTPPRAASPADPGASELLGADAFREPLGNVSLGLSDEHGSEVDLECAAGEPRALGRASWEQVGPERLAANMSWSVELDCPVDRENYERLWRLLAYYSDAPAHLQREATVSEDPRRSYRYRQDAERHAQYFTGVRAVLAARPGWLMQPSLGLRLSRPQSTGKTVKLVLSSRVSQVVEAELERSRSRAWVALESASATQVVALVGGTARMACDVRGSGEAVVRWVTPGGSRLTAPYGGPHGRLTASGDGRLVIRSVAPSDAGLYYCVAAAPGDTQALPVRLAVEEPSGPSPGDERLHPAPVQGWAGQPIALPCEASGAPRAQVHWILPGGRIVSAAGNSSGALVSPSGALRVPRGQVSDSGYYKCVAISPHGVDTLTTEVSVSRPAARTPSLTHRKPGPRPQSAAAVRTKVTVGAEEPLDGSGGGQLMKDGHPRTSADVGGRRVPVSGRRVGPATRKTWRRPALLRKPLPPPVGRPVSAPADGPRRRVSVASNKIDPRKWADILAKVRDRTLQSSVTPHTARRTAERRRAPGTTSGALAEGSMEGSGELAPTAPMSAVTATNDILGTPGAAERSHRVAQATPPDLRTNTVHVTPQPRQTQSTRADRSTPSYAATRVAPTTDDAEPSPPSAVDPGWRQAPTRRPAPPPPTTPAPQGGHARWQTQTNRASGPGAAAAHESSQGSRERTGDTGASVATTTHNASHFRRGEGEGGDRGRHSCSGEDGLLSADASRATSPPAAPTRPKPAVVLLGRPSTAPPEATTPPAGALGSPPASKARERGRERGREKRPSSNRKNGGGRRRNKEKRRNHKLNATPQLTTTAAAAVTPVNVRAAATSAPLKIESAALTSTLGLPTAVPFTGGQVTTPAAAVSHQGSKVSRLEDDGEAGQATRPSGSSPAPADPLRSTVAPPPRATRALLASPPPTRLPSSEDPLSTRELSTGTVSLRGEGEASGRYTTAVPPRSLPGASTLPPVTAPSEAQRGSSAPGESPGRHPTGRPQWNPDVGLRQGQSGRPYTHSKAAENAVRGPAPLLPPPSSSSLAATAQTASPAPSSGDGEGSGAEGPPGEEPYQDASGKRPTNMKEPSAVGRAEPPADPTGTDVGLGRRKQTADPEGRLAASAPTTSSEPGLPSSSVTPVIALSSSSSGEGRVVGPLLTTPRPVGSGLNHIEDGHASREEAPGGQGGKPPPLSPHGQPRHVGANQTLAAANQTLATTNQTLAAANQTLAAANQTLAAANQTLASANQTLASANQTLASANQTLAAANQTLASAKQTLAAANQTLASASQTLASANQTLASANQTLASANQTLAAANQTLASANQTLASANQTLASANQTLAAANQTLAVPWREAPNTSAVDLRPGPIRTPTTPDLPDAAAVGRATASAAPPPWAPPSSPGASGEWHPAGPLPAPGPLPPRANPWILRAFHHTVTVNAEADAQLPCEAVGQPRPFLSWTKLSTGASIAQNTKVSRFEVHPNGTLLIRRAQPTDRGRYVCRVQSQHGRDQVTLTLAVLLRPPRVLQPRHRDVAAHQGAAVHLDCPTQGHPPPSATWVLPDLVRVLTAAQPHAAADRRLALLGNGTLRIAGAGAADRGVYRCVASSVAGSDAVTVRLDVLPSAPPAIAEAEREDASLAPGESGLLHCTAAGSPPPVVRWSTPGEHGGPANVRVFPNGTLQVRAAVPGNAGRYECVAVSALGVARRGVLLSVTAPAAPAAARISAASPRRSEVAYGGALRLDCLSAGHPAPRVLWRTPTQKLVDSQYSYDPRIKVFPNGSLALRPVTEEDAGDFLCLVRNRLGDDFAALSVAVLTQPAKIQRQKLRSSQEVASGGRLRVDCEASGTPPPAISWALPDGTMVNAADKLRAGRTRRYVVFDNGSLLLNEVGAPQEGDYTCYAENQLGRDQMKVSVRVTEEGAGPGQDGAGDRPRVVSAPYGQTASLHCRALRGPGGPGSSAVSWVSPTHRVLGPVPGKYQVLGDGTLVVQRVQRSDRGNYTCAAGRDAAGGGAPGRAVTALEVLLAAPTINGLPAGGVASAVVTATAGRGGPPLLVDCVAAGTPPPRSMWVLPGNVVLPVPYPGGGAGRTSVHANGTLEIRGPRPGDAGRLACVARNEAGEARLEVELSVREAAGWTRAPGAVPLTPGRTMTLSCPLPGGPAAARTWVLPGGLPLPSGARLPLASHRPADGALLLLRPSAADVGVYRCLARGHPGLAVAVTPPVAAVAVSSGRPFWLHCRGAGALRWTLPSGAVLARATQAGRYAALPNGTLAVRQASGHDGGVYTCRTPGAETAVEVEVVVSHAPRIADGPPPASYARRGVALQLNCAVAAAAGAAQVAWETPDRARLPVGSQPRLYGNKYVHPRGSLVIQNPTARDAGTYRCTARNAAGADSRATYLSVL